MTNLPAWMTTAVPATVPGGRVILNPNGARPPLVSVATGSARSTGTVSLAKGTDDAPRFTRTATGARAGLGWVNGYEVKAYGEIVSGAWAGDLAVIVYRPDHVQPYEVIVTAYTCRAPLGSHVSDNRRAGTYATWDGSMALVLALTRRY
jgi:hypothetical protein